MTAARREPLAGIWTAATRPLMAAMVCGLEVDSPPPEFVDTIAGNSSRADANSGLISEFESVDDA